MNNGFDFSFYDQTLCALPSGALWIPDSRVLCISDMHLGKSDRIARRSGRLLPPYETRATLERLDGLIDAHDPDRVICLGDSFDDLDAAENMDDADLMHLARLQAGRDWVWIEGNHDPGPVAISGQHLQQLVLGDIVFRHIARPGASGEVSGHYHPKCRLPVGAACPAFLIDAQRVILPAFGTFTGGLRASDPVLRGLMSGDAIAVLTGRKAMPVPFHATV
jgi:DNA ligase-associated metallophosphoesterase